MNLYTCKYFYPNLIIVIITLFMIVLGIIYVTKKELKKGLFFLIAGIAFLLLYLCSYFDYYHNVYMLKNSDRLQTIEGNLTNLITTDFGEMRYDTFTINDTQFFVSCNSLEPGYHRPAVYGGVLNQEGMHVRISYIEYEGNKYIMSIDRIN